MKILLINPPSEHMIRASLPPVVEDSTGFYPPLGLLYVAAYAECVEGCEVKLLDCDAQGIRHSDLFEKITAFRPDVVGIQAMTFTLIDAVEVAHTAKKASPDAPVVMGGPHPTLYPEETISIPEVDVIVRGEGEYAFEALLRAFRSGRPIEFIPGVLTKAGSCGGSYPEKLDHIQNLDELKMPARHLLDLSRYFSSLVSPKRITTMMSSRGCPGKCVFCDRPQMGKLFRKRSAESVVKEMTYCVRDLRVKEIIFYDDTFTIDRERVIEICDRIIDDRLQVLWDIRARVDTMTPQMISKLRQAGCVRIHYGVETGSPRLQQLIRKNLSLDKVREVFTLTRKAGIETLGYFMIGLP
ncbi:MAG: radical SAM protein, partial [Deltaproteobacteria bacterium]|nr:radical SAM protein [Deltaproteobacteria bacterium]